MEESHEVLFLRKLQRLLDEGEFTATYKFALLQALADLSVESKYSGNDRLSISVGKIAEKFVMYYWRQVVPFRSSDLKGEAVLMHNTGQQAAVVNQVLQVRGKFGGHLGRAQEDTLSWRAIVRNVSNVVRTMPLWKLQVVAGEADEFLYHKSESSNEAIVLLPRVASHFRSFHGLITRLVRAAWVDQVRTIGANKAVLGDSPDLDEFLFGSERNSLESVRPILKECQEGRCFYCELDVKGNGEVDHFIPWSRYPTDLGHNFVLAHSNCNRRKSDFLAHPEHLARWSERNRLLGDNLTTQFNRVGFQHDLQRSFVVAAWAYDQGEKSGAHVWIKDRSFVSLPSEWRRSLT